MKLNKDSTFDDFLNWAKELLVIVRIRKITLSVICLLSIIIGGGLGFVLESKKQSAEFIIAAEEQGPSGMDGLLAQFGLEVGSSNPGGLFEGESLVRLFQLRSLIERSILSKVEISGDSVILADKIWNSMKESKNEVFKSVNFYQSTTSNQKLNDSALFLIQLHVRDNILSVNRPDKKQSFIMVNCTHENPEVAVILGKLMIETVKNYYIETLTQKARYNLNVLKLEADSVQRILNQNLNRNAAIVDLNVNPMMQRARVSQNRSTIDLQISISLYGELIKNLKLAEISLRKQTPLIQIVESPKYPLEKVGFSWWYFVIFGLFAGLGLNSLIIYFTWKIQKK